MACICSFATSQVTFLTPASLIFSGSIHSSCAVGKHERYYSRVHVAFLVHKHLLGTCASNTINATKYPLLRNVPKI